MHSLFANGARVLVTGITRIHGWPVYRKLKSHLHPERLFGIRPPGMKIPKDTNAASVCMTDRAQLARLREEFRPTHLLHAAGVCDLDMCEANPAFAHDINVKGSKNIVDLFSDSCYIMYLSADLVFSGNRPSPQGYEETDERIPSAWWAKPTLWQKKK
jgi:dTDP-4-dehydrorhamnose reductase